MGPQDSGRRGPVTARPFRACGRAAVATAQSRDPRLLRHAAADRCSSVRDLKTEQLQGLNMVSQSRSDSGLVLLVVLAQGRRQRFLFLCFQRRRNFGLAQASISLVLCSLHRTLECSQSFNSIAVLVDVLGF